MKLGELISKRLFELNMKPSELSRKSGIPHATISRIISGEIKSPKADSLESISKTLQVSIDWLVTGRESKARHDITTSENKELDGNTVSIPVLIDQTNQQNYFDVLVGIDINIENLKKLVHFTDYKKLVAYSMPDDSMSDTFNTGDWLLIDQTVNKIAQDGIYLTKYNEKVYLRRFQLSLSNDLKMIADNSNYEPYILDNEMINILNITGKVIYAWNGRRV